MGSFYNHFDSKEQLFEAAVAECSTPTAPCSIGSRNRSRIPPKHSPQLPADRPALPASPSGEPDPARQRARPDVVGPWAGPRALRDIETAARGRTVRGRGSRTGVGRRCGALLGLGKLLRTSRSGTTLRRRPVTEDVLRLFGLTAEEAHEICTRPLPDLVRQGRQPDLGSLSRLKRGRVSARAAGRARAAERVGDNRGGRRRGRRSAHSPHRGWCSKAINMARSRIVDCRTSLARHGDRARRGA